MNAFMGDTKSQWVAKHADGNNAMLKRIRKLSDSPAPGPSDVFVLIDEHENSINDSHFFPFDDLRTFNNNAWLDAPSGRHGNAAGFNFGDGHGEIHKWQARLEASSARAARSCPTTSAGCPSPSARTTSGSPTTSRRTPAEPVAGLDGPCAAALGAGFFVSRRRTGMIRSPR